MKNEMTLFDTMVSTSAERETVEMMINAVKSPAEWLRKYYSAILNKDVNMHQTWLITKVQLALVATIVLAGQSILLGAASVAWLAMSLRSCKRSFSK